MYKLGLGFCLVGGLVGVAAACSNDASIARVDPDGGSGTGGAAGSGGSSASGGVGGTAGSGGSSGSGGSAGVDGGTCPTDFAAAEGTPCSSEGQICGGPCTDPCNFCNLLRCEAGKWERLEAFPDPNCRPACVPGAGSCGTGETCVEGCTVGQAQPGGVCSVANRDGCGCGVALDPCTEPGTACLMPSCCEADGLCLTPEERTAVCSSAEASRFDCAGTQSALEHVACELPTGALRYGIFQKDLIENRCLVVQVEVGPTGLFSNVNVSAGYGIGRIHITNSAADCDKWLTQPTTFVDASGASGSLTVTGSGTPSFSASMNISFPSGASWVPSQKTLTLTNLVSGPAAACN